MRYGANHKLETRKRVLIEAGKAIRAEGPHKIGVAEVMGRAGLTHGGFYAHFASKDDLVAAAVEGMFDEGRERMVREMTGRSPAQALAAYIDFYLSAAHRDARSTGCPLPFLSADAPRMGHVARERFAGGVRQFSAGLSARLKELNVPQPDDAAASLLAELVGALSLARAEPDPGHSDAILERSRVSLKKRFGLEAGS